MTSRSRMACTLPLWIEAFQPAGGLRPIRRGGTTRPGSSPSCGQSCPRVEEIEIAERAKVSSLFRGHTRVNAASACRAGRPSSIATRMGGNISVWRSAQQRGFGAAGEA